MARPTITFRVKLTPDLIGLSHPARNQNNQDQAIIDQNTFTASISTWIPDLARANYVKHDGDTFSVSGQNATYIKNTYATGANAILEVVSIV